MSRSYKKTPYCGDNKSNGMKKVANHKVRRLLKNPDVDFPHKAYRKAFCSWDICDYKYIQSSFESYYRDELRRWAEWRRYSWYKEKPKPTREECWKDYCKIYIRK